MSELESVERDPSGRVVAVRVEGRTLEYTPDVAGELRWLHDETAAARAELAAARRVVRAAQVAVQEWEAWGTRGVGNTFADLAAALAGPGPTPEPATKPAAVLLREIAERDPEGHKRALGRAYGLSPRCTHGEPYPHLLGEDDICPGPTDDAQARFEQQAVEREDFEDEQHATSLRRRFFGPTDDERPATTREVGSGPTNPLPKGADDE